MRNIYFNTSKEALRSKPVRDVRTPQPIITNAQSSNFGDDFYKVTQVSYDTDLISKGITSSSPVILSTIPLKKLTEADNAESDILNIQRNLSTITLDNVSGIINDLTGSVLTQNEVEVINDDSHFRVFKNSVGKITAAYQAKSAYMTHLENLYYLETDSGFNNNYGEGSFPQSIQTVSITETSTKQLWVESELKMQKRGYNISQVMQILRNAFARKQLGKNISTDYENFDSMTLAPVTSPLSQSAKDSFFSNLYTLGNGESFESLAEIVDLILIADSKDLTYTKNGADPKSIYENLVGNIANFDRRSRLSSRFNAGIFTGLLRFEEDGQSVLSLDVNVGSQADLKQYIAADEYFLGMPLTVDLNLLKQRSDSFTSVARSIEDALKENVPLLVGQVNTNGQLSQDLESWNAFLAQMNSMMESSFFTTNDGLSAFRFSLLLTSLSGSLYKIAKIMMLRDRLRRTQDYVDTSRQDEFLVNVKNELEIAIDSFLDDLDVEIASDDLEISSKLGRTFRPLGQFETIEFRINGDWTDKIFRQIKDDLLNPTGHQWDNFFSAAVNAEVSNSNIDNNMSTIAWESGSTISAKAGISKGFMELDRDQRAFVYLVKWISIISSLPFDVGVLFRPNPSETGQDSEYFQSSRHRGYNFTFDFSSSLYDQLKKSLVLTLPDMVDFSILSNFSRISYPITQSILQDTQAFYDAVDLVYKYLMQTSTLLSTASRLAYEYIPSFGEKLSNNYTFNSVQALNRQARFATRQSTTFKDFSKDLYKDTSTLNGFLKFVQSNPDVSVEEDSYVVICGIPYGMLDRLGVFNQNKIHYIDVSLLIRSINATQDDDVVIKKRYPATGFIEHQLLSYSPAINSSAENILESTSLYELNINGNFTPNTQFTSDSKRNELESVSLLNYFELFLGINFNQYLSVQNDLGDLSTQQMRDIKETYTRTVFSRRFDDLIQARYVAAGLNSIQMSKDKIISTSLSGPVFDKIIAIPVDSKLLKDNRSGFLVDMLVSIDAVGVDRIVPEAPEVARVISNRDYVSLLANAITQNSIQTTAAAFQPNVFGAR